MLLSVVCGRFPVTGGSSSVVEYEVSCAVLMLHLTQTHNVEFPSFDWNKLDNAPSTL